MPRSTLTRGPGFWKPPWLSLFLNRSARPNLAFCSVSTSQVLPLSEQTRILSPLFKCNLLIISPFGLISWFLEQAGWIHHARHPDHFGFRDHPSWSGFWILLYLRSCSDTNYPHQQSDSAPGVWFRRAAKGKQILLLVLGWHSSSDPSRLLMFLLLMERSLKANRNPFFCFVISLNV